MIEVRFNIEVAIKPRNGIDGVDLTRVGRLPFVPHTGMFLSVDDDDFRKVESVYWSTREGFVVWFEFDEHASLKNLKKHGWKEL